MHRRHLFPAALLVVVLAVSAACVPPPPAPAAPTTPATELGPVMGPNRYTASELGAWFASKKIGDAKLTRAEVTELAQLFLDEGAIEGVTGDIAFIQAVLETGWFRFSARMPVTNNNFSGIGAVDSGNSSAAFATRREGVQAQIQHLRAYADPTVTVAKLARPLVDPRFSLVNPKGKAPNWSQYGSGNWATDPGYAQKLADLHAQLRAFTLAAH
jgi:flagellum-specific peptidoglycan hydrolase FlgJ